MALTLNRCQVEVIEENNGNTGELAALRQPAFVSIISFNITLKVIRLNK